jgi:hypothetical protein
MSCRNDARFEFLELRRAGFAIPIQKGCFPMVQVKVYDTENKRNEETELAAA